MDTKLMKIPALHVSSSCISLITVFQSFRLSWNEIPSLHGLLSRCYCERKCGGSSVKLRMHEWHVGVDIMASHDSLITLTRKRGNISLIDSHSHVSLHSMRTDLSGFLIRKMGLKMVKMWALKAKSVIWKLFY